MNTRALLSERNFNISVVIPTWNYGRFISEALDSVLQQTFKPYEIIVVDDGSTDNTAEALDPYQSRIHYIHQENRGLSAARNRGILAAGGEWIALLDSDDTWYPRKLQMQAEFALAQPQFHLIGTLESTCKRSDRFESEATVITTKDLFGGAVFGPSSVIVRKSRLLEVGLFNQHLRAVEDRDIWLRLSNSGPAARLNSRLWTYRRHQNQMHSNAERMQKAYEQVLNQFFKDFPAHETHRRLAYAYYHFDSAEEYSLGGNLNQAFSHLFRSFIQHPTPLPRLCSTRRFNRAVLLAKWLIGEKRLSSIFRMLKRKARHESPTGPVHTIQNSP